MHTITIPDKAAKKEEFIAIPRKEYEALLRAKNGRRKPIIVKRSPSFRVAKKHEKFYDKLDQEITESLRDYYAGNSFGPFDTIEELRKSLES